MKSPLFIIGCPACGKSTFGRALARKTGYEFIDLDRYIENRFRTTVSKIFATHGEAEFRRMEGFMLREVGEFENAIIACGGGTPCFGDNMEWMLAHGRVIWLDTSPDVLASRVKLSDRRPMFHGLDENETAAKIRELLAARTPVYERAHIIISGDQLDTREQIAATIDSYLAAHP